jgi:nickel ABC transporter permease subunit NikB
MRLNTIFRNMISRNAIIRHPILRRILQLIPVLLGISIVSFMLLQLMPSDPAVAVLRVSDIPTTPESIAAMRSQLGLDRPLPIQYLDWLWHVLRLDFGRSFVTGKPVLQEIINYIPATLGLMTVSIGLIICISLPLGILAALYRDSLLDQCSRFLVYVATSMPNFWLGFLLLYGFSYQLGWVSVTRQGTIEDWILPAMTLAFSPATVYARLLRGSLLESLGQNYVLYARARGLSERVVVLQYVLKNALLPIVTVFGMSFGHLMAGTVVVENVFALPGLGRFAVQSILNRDVPMIQCYVCLIAVLFVGINGLVDVSYGYLDPRIRLGAREI